MDRVSAKAKLVADERAAWVEYLEATRTQDEPRYGELEPWAWNRLGVKLRAIHARRLAVLDD